MRLPPLLAALLLLAILPLPAQAPTVADWTILVYLDADNNLESVGVVDFLELSSVGSTPRVNVVVQFDRTPGFDASHGNWVTAKRFYVTPGMTPTPANAIVDLGEVNMADPATLVSFVNWGLANYPARYYFLVLWDHGDGWQGVVVDDDPIAGDRLTAIDLRTALSAVVAANGRRVDLLGNDACRMTLEIQYELAGFVDYFVGSEKDEPLDGWPYDALLASLVGNPGISPSQLAATLVDKYVMSYEGRSPYSVALSAVNAAALRSLVGVLNGFLDELAVHQPYFTAEVVAARAATEHYELGGGPGGLDYDLYDFVDKLLERIPSRRLERQGVALRAAIQGAVAYERHWDNPAPINGVSAKSAHGLSLWFPTVGGDPLYGALALSRDSRWDEFLRNYSAGTRPQVAANASAASVDANGDGYLDAIVLTFGPTVNGTMAVDLYRDGAYVFNRDYPVTAGRTDEVRYPLNVGGFYEVTFYLVDGAGLVNLTRVRELVVQELVAFRGTVRGVDGGLLDSAAVTLVHLASGRRITATTVGGTYGIEVPYPTWFRDGDGLALEVRAGDMEARVTFNATMSAERSSVRDLRLSTAGMGPWWFAIGALASLAAVGVAGTMYFWWRLRRFKKIP